MRPWPPKIFCDTSFFFACLVRGDENHSTAVRWLESSQKYKSVFLTTWDILSETVTLLRRKCGYRVSWDFIEDVIPSLRLLSTDESSRLEALSIFKRFAKDKKLSFCDCLSAVVITTQLPDVPTATFDHHFKSLGLATLPT